MSLNPATYAEALERAQKRPRKPRTPLKPRKGIKTSRRAILRERGPKKKRLTTGQLKKRAWKEFSVYIRANNATRDLGLERCVTCGVVKHWKELQAGHFIAGRLNGNLFDERGVHPQCGLCNVVKKGNGPAYYKFMLAKYGQEVIDELMRQNDQTHKWAPGELQGIWEKYKSLNEQNPLTKEA